MRLWILMFLATMTSGCGCTVVGTGERGVETRFGEIQGGPLPEGLHFYNPLTSSVHTLDVREVKMDGKTKPYTRDTQMAEIHYTLTYAPDATQIHMLFKNLGDDWADKIVRPVVEDTIQTVIGSEVADDLMAHREAVRQLTFDNLKSRLESRSVSVRQLSFINVDFDDAYEKAVEQKVVAIQKAAEAKNVTVQIQEQAHQKVIAAEAEAKSMQIRSEALSKNQALVQYEAVQKWDGKLPSYMTSGAQVPFLQLGAK